jgi:tetratricopeptide (TPR) repeat protein/transcriptional regulator with XRE-family HTH domain
MLGGIVREHRRRLGITQEELAARTGIGLRTIRDIESDRVRRPRQITVRLLADTFGLVGDDRERFHRTALPGPDGDSVTDPPPDGHARPAPGQLPPDLAGYTGRQREHDQLDAVLAATGDHPTAVGVVVLSGTPGVGKTTLAVHWAHRVADRFPDGQLYVNLRGYDAGGPVVTATEAVRGFLDAFGVPPQRIPANPDAQVGLYRSLLAGKRVLVVLDNAASSGQVRPLLPGSPGCLAVVTSRKRLTGLIAAEGAHPLALDLLTVAEARELLARRLGPPRLAAEPAAADDLIASSARLPLALAIVAARAAVRPGLPLGVLAEELRGTAGRLDAFSDEDLSTNVRAVFSWSYRTLSLPAARLFRLVGLHPGPDISTAAAASLAGLPLAEARRLLAELAEAHLVAEPTPGRYACHDLLRTYAAEQATIVDSEPDRRCAMHRVLDHYLRTAHAAAQRLDTGRDAVELPPIQPGVTPVEIDDSDQALTVLTADYPVLLATIDLAASAGFDDYAWQIPWALGTFFARQGRWQDWAAVQRTGLAAGERLGDRLAQARAHRALGRAYTWLGRHDEVASHYHRAFDLYGAVGDRSGQAHCRSDLAELLVFQGRHREALDYARQAGDLCAAIGNLTGQARNLNCVGWCHAQLGEYEQAVDTCRHALALLRKTGDRYGTAATLDSLGFAYHELGRHQEAIAHYRKALDLRREVGDRYGEAETLSHLGDTHHAIGDADAAREGWRQALAILAELDHPDADDLRNKLHKCRQTAPACDP